MAFSSNASPCSVTVVIPHYDRVALLRRALESLRAQSRKPDYIVVVDNGSRDGSQDLARSLGAMVIQAPSNLGFAVATNWGLTATNADFVAVLNNDVELDPNWLQELLAAADQFPDAGFFVGKIASAANPDKIDGTGDLITRAMLPWRAGNGMSIDRFSDPEEIALGSFTAILIRQDCLAAVGLLDPIFESYLEDVDFGLRCAAEGITGRYVPSARSTHVGSATLGSWSPESTRLQSRNQLFLIARHCPPVYLQQNFWAILVGQLLWALVALRHGAGLACIQGKWEAWQKWPQARESLSSHNGNSIAKVVGQGEIQLRKAAPKDWLWRLYRLLT